MPAWCSGSRPRSKTASGSDKKAPRSGAEYMATSLRLAQTAAANQQRVIVISRVPPLSDGTVLISLLF